MINGYKRKDGSVSIQTCGTAGFNMKPQAVTKALSTKLETKCFKKEAKRVIKKMPSFEPGLNNNYPVAVSYTIPITFNRKK